MVCSRDSVPRSIVFGGQSGGKEVHLDLAMDLALLDRPLRHVDRYPAMILLHEFMSHRTFITYFGGLTEESSRLKYFRPTARVAVDSPAPYCRPEPSLRPAQTGANGTM
ncbi:hypothetical protein CHU98_g4747 [Xylaria longipes]|nr:hypothetical protein CHU98_g4747 [Xylaria longipes]